jgi:MraZ protein
MFRGSAPAKIDDKGRLKIPTNFRGTLEEHGSELFVTSLQGDRALLYPLPMWEEIENRLAAMPSTDPTKQHYLQRVNYFGQQVRMDAQGRIIIPQILREKAEMNGDVVVSAQLDHLVVWNREQIERRLEEEPFTDQDLQVLTERGI